MKIYNKSNILLFEDGADSILKTVENAVSQKVNLRGANLRDADLRDADLRSAKLSGADLSGAKLPKFQIPQRKSLTVYKKLRDGAIAQLRILRRARRTAALISNKCRAEYAIVEKIWDRNGNEIPSGISKHDSNFKYETGKRVSVSNFDDDIRIECRPGIHFFMTRKEAEEY